MYTVAGEWLEQTEDKMFILNPLEADRYLESEDLRMAGASDYAINKKILSDLPGDNKPWIMRQAVLDDMANDIQPIFPTDFVVQMGIDGQIDTEKGERATRQNYVRPAMWVYLGE